MFRFTALIAVGFLGCSGMAMAQAETEATETLDSAAFQTPPKFVPVIGFMTSRHDFGDVKQGDELEFVFDFLNNGSADLLIEDARAEASGVGVGVTHEPIPAGQTGKVYVSVKTSDMEGEQFIRIRLTSNAHNGNSTLYLMLNVVPSED